MAVLTFPNDMPVILTSIAGGALVGTAADIDVLVYNYN